MHYFQSFFIKVDLVRIHFHQITLWNGQKTRKEIHYVFHLFGVKSSKSGSGLMHDFENGDREVVLSYLLKLIQTCCRGQYQVSRWSLTGCVLTWRFRIPPGSNGVCSRSIPGKKPLLCSCIAVLCQHLSGSLIISYLLNPHICSHHLVLLILWIERKVVIAAWTSFIHKYISSSRGSLCNTQRK